MSTAEEQPAPKTPAKPKKWRRRLKIAAITFLIAGFVGRVIMVIALPLVISRVAAFYDLDVKYDRQSLAIAGGQMVLSGVKVYPREGGDALLQADYIHGEIIPWKLLTGKLHVLRAEADGVDLLVHRTSDGRIPLLDQIATHAAKRQQATTQPTAIDFTSPLIVEELRLTKVRAHVVDDAVSPKLDASFDVDMRANHLGAPQGTPLQFEVDAWADGVLDSLRVEGTGVASGRSLDAHARLYLRGLHPKPLAGYLQPQGLKPVADSIGLEGEATIQARPAPSSTTAVAANCTIEKVRVTVDDQDFASLGAIKIDAGEIDTNSAKISSIVMTQGRLAAGRDTSGEIKIAGFDLVPVTATRTEPSSPMQYTVTLGELKLHDLEAKFIDESPTPPVTLKAVVADISLKPRPRGAATDIAGTISLPGVAKSVRLDGVVQPGTNSQSAQLTLHAEGIRPEALQPYLTPLGIESQLNDAQLTGSLKLDVLSDPNGALTASAKLNDIRFADEPELLAMKSVDVNNVHVDPATGRVRIESIDLTGPGISITRQPDGAIDALGMRFRKAPPGATPVAAAAATSAPTTTLAAAPTTAPALPRIELDRLTWKGVKVSLTDLATTGAGSVSIDDAGVEIKDFVLDLAGKAGSEKAGSIRAWLTSPQLVGGGLKAEGSLTPGPQSLAADLKVTAEHLKTTPLAPYLSSFGVEPLLNDGSLSLQIKAGLIRGFDGSVTSWLDLNDVSLGEGSDELVGVDALKVDSVTLKSNQIEVGDVSIHNSRARATREPDGAIVAAGVRIRLPQASTQPASTTQPATTEPSESPLVVTLKKLDVDNAQLHWTDQAVTPVVNTTAFVTTTVNDLTLGRHASPATFTLQLTLEGIVDDVKITGDQLDPTPGAELAKMDITAAGVHGAPIAGYLPPGITADVADGRFKGTILASRLHGVRSAYLDLINVDWRDGESNPLLSLDLARLAASRIDPDQAISIEEVSLNNFEGAASIGADGRIHAFGVSIGNPPPATQPSTGPSSAAAPEEAPVSSAQAARPLPLMTLNKLDLNVRKFTFKDDRRPSAAPITIADLRLHNSAPIVLGGPMAEQQPPARIELSGELGPLVKQFQLNLDASPFATEPVATVEIAASGINGTGVTDLVPEVKDLLDGGTMTDGRFHAWAQLHAKFNRRGPRDFDLARGFDLDLSAKDIAFRDHDVGRVLAGVNQVTAETIHVEPRKSIVHVKSLEIDTPIAFASREKDGIHAMGLVLKLPTTAKSSTTEPSSQPAVVATASPSPAPSGPTTKPTGEIRIDRLQISGLDVRVEDRAVDPPLIMPLKNLDLEVRDISTLALYEDRPIRFNAVVESGKVELPRRGGAKDAATTQQTEERELFSQATASGSMSLYPKLHGYTKLALNGFDLASMRGEAGALGVDLAGGIFDADINTRFADEGSLDLRSKFVMTDLHLTEPANGPIQTHLALSVPLDVAISAVTDPDGGITIPLHVPVEQGKVSTGEIIGAGVGALTQVLVTAVASVPAKAVGGLTNMIGLGSKDTGQPIVVTLPFKPGDASIAPDSVTQINQLITVLKKDKNSQATIRGEICQADVDVAGDRANPGPSDCRALAEQLRTQRAQMALNRQSLAAQLTAELASSSASAVKTTAQLQSLDRQIADADDAMDQLYDMLRPGAANQASRRTRAAVLQIADLRLKNVNDALMASNIPDATDRIQKTAATDKIAESSGDGSVTVTLVRRKRQK